MLKIKTPPCRVCGQPSTHVLKGDPPLPLCERCFQVEKVKRTRFAPEAFQSQPASEPPAERPEATEAPAQPPRKIIEEGQYFDTFDEIPDIPSEDEPVHVVAVAETREAPPAEGIRPANAQEPALDPFSREHSSFTPEEIEGPTPSPAETLPPAPAQARPRPPAQPATPEAGSAPTFDYPEDDMAMPPEPPPAKPSLPAPASPKPRAAPLPAQGRFSLEEEVKRSLEQEKVQAPEAAAETPLAAVPVAARRHWPAYAVSAGVIILVLLAAGYFLLRQRTPGPETSPPASRTIPQPVASAPAAPAIPAPSPELAGQVAEKLRLYRASFQLDTLEGYQKALQVLDQARELDPQNSQVEALRIETHAFMASLTDNFLYARAAKKLLNQASPAVQAEPAFQRSQIHILLVDRDTPDGRTALADYLAKNPSDGIGFYLQGLSYLKDQPPDFPAARENFQKAVQLDPTLTRAYVELGNIDRAFRKLDDALASFRQVHKLSPLKQEADTAIAELEAEINNNNQVAAPPPAQTVVAVPLPPQPASGATAPPPLALPVSAATRVPVPPAANPASASALEASGDALTDNLREIISEVSRPMSRVPAPPKAPAKAAAKKPQPPAPPPETIPPEERPAP